MKAAYTSGLGKIFPPVLVCKFMEKYRVPVSTLLIISLLHLTVSCNYYKVNTAAGSENQFAKINEAINTSKYFIVSDASHRLFATDLVLSKDSLEMQLQDIPPVVAHTYENVNEKNRKYDPHKGGKEILNEVRIILNEGNTISIGELSIPLTSINRVDVIDRATGRTVASHVFGTLGVIAGAIVVLGVIVALTKSSCPFVYTYDGQGYALAGETFGGAIFAPVERDDYLPLPGIKPVAGNYRLQIANELKERQYINLAQLIVVEHANNSTALMDRKGKIYTITAPQAPVSAVTTAQKDYTKEMRERDKHLFLFNEAGNDELKSELILTFNKKDADENGRLVLNLKNSLWLDYIYGEFTKLFGSYYNRWAAKQKFESGKELNQWFFDQELPLKVYVKRNNAWEYVDYVNLIGPLAAARDVVVPVKHLSDIEGKQLEIKVESGFMFWELDYAGFDVTPNEPVRVQHTLSSEAVTNNGTDVNALLASTDEQYLQQLQVGDKVELKFDAPEASGKQVSVFLHTSGYYEHIRNYEGIPDMAELISFRKPGKFTAFSKEKYLEFAGGITEPEQAKEEVAYAH
ncbi:hypothetical protein I2I11_14585 [Pontibacter sp. 172403-2]|uniref:hypothetical protein n=1 Tax=Pontibacter rufus TaxID=2791028 RepID=UPI0018AF8B9F|nr:hypothetical protein [Pontibacter sp. 172403-2]MBF9254528.1 hypothetical protein [Pontibacter sp. 172403-2]